MSLEFMQPIVRGIQAVGSVQIKYRYNNKVGDQYLLPIPASMILDAVAEDPSIDTTDFLQLAGFRLDSEFLRANPQIASSFQIPILGGGGVALTNNNRTGTLNLVCPKVSTPNASDDAASEYSAAAPEDLGSIHTDSEAAIGVRRTSRNKDTAYYDMVTIAQMQQGQEGGDSCGATILVGFEFCNKLTVIRFSGCTIASVDPVGLAGNDAVNYAIAINYLDWDVNYTLSTVTTW